jgi:hypothetical protein
MKHKKTRVHLSLPKSPKTTQTKPGLFLIDPFPKPTEGQRSQGRID